MQRLCCPILFMEMTPTISHIQYETNSISISQYRPFYQMVQQSFPPRGPRTHATLRSWNHSTWKSTPQGWRGIEHMAGRWNPPRVPCSTAWSHATSRWRVGEHLRGRGLLDSSQGRLSSSRAQPLWCPADTLAAADAWAAPSPGNSSYERALHVGGYNNSTEQCCIALSYMYFWSSSQFCRSGRAPSVKAILRTEKWEDEEASDLLSSTQVGKVDMCRSQKLIKLSESFWRKMIQRERGDSGLWEELVSVKSLKA